MIEISDARSLAKKHLEIAMKNPTPTAHRIAAWRYAWKGQHKEAIVEGEHTIALEPNNAHSPHVMVAV